METLFVKKVELAEALTINEVEKRKKRGDETIETFEISENEDQYFTEEAQDIFNKYLDFIDENLENIEDSEINYNLLEEFANVISNQDNQNFKIFIKGILRNI